MDFNTRKLDLTPRRQTLAFCMVVAVACLANSSPAFSQDLSQLEEEAIQAAVLQAQPWVVRVEPVGGLETVDGEAIGVGPTSGVVVGKEGYIVTSSYAFANRPASILVTLPTGAR